MNSAILLDNIKLKSRIIKYLENYTLRWHREELWNNYRSILCMYSFNWSYLSFSLVVILYYKSILLNVIYLIHLSFFQLNLSLVSNWYSGKTWKHSKQWEVKFANSFVNSKEIINFYLILYDLLDIQFYKI